ncbi:hypothetical protein CYLTODRAFT_55871 [Cylindrobasidium torrendii FP15055 ss-10]|uniref:Uncharacterized protein n=1 Tax=Cylindrobasidium torrendii FP15055 ss-10 TaxID=1314674 RepID=A0A0D7BQ41_9AGAR|nr:hypothetical protein CYLTODRAFT_55871 [Cylindrobasidium torrendii FP15055 ss-10]
MHPHFVGPVYIKHPVTGKVTTHELPYDSLPVFKLKTAIPVIVAHMSYIHLQYWPGITQLRDIVYTNGCICDGIAVPRAWRQESTFTNDSRVQYM